MKGVFNIILAVDKEFGYDKNGKIPWRKLYSEDMKMFKKTTTGNGNNCVLMGRKTWDSIGRKPLVDRYNIVLTRDDNMAQIDDNIKNVDFATNIDCALKSIHLKSFDNIFVLGGESLWNEFLNRKLVNKIFITMIPDVKDFQCTSHFDIFSHKRFKDFKMIEENILDLNDENKKPAIVKVFKYHNKEELIFLKTLDKIIKKGIYKMDRSGVGTYSLFGKSFSYDIKNYRLPVFTHRKVFIRGIIEELLFFVSGKTNTKVLEEKKVNIWKQHTSREYLDKMGLSSDKYKDGSYGPAYGFQLRHWGAEFEGDDADYTGKGIDQLQYIVDLLKDKEKRNSRRILFSYWNPSVIEMVPLPSCFLKDTLVLTNEGYRNIQDIKVNDMVLTHKGNWKKVLNLQKNDYSDTIYSFKLQYNNKIIKCTKEHPFYVRQIKKNSNFTDKELLDFEWVTAENIINKKHVMCCPINKKSIIPEFTIKRGLNETRYEIINKKLDNKDEYFMMGYYLGDGWLDWKTKKNRFYMCIKKNDPVILQRISKVLNLSVNKNTTDKILYVDIYNKVWWEILKDFGHMAVNKKIPEWIHNAPNEYVKEFIEGYTSADGCRKFKTYTTVSHDIAYGLQRLYAKLKIITSIQYQIRPKTKIIEGRTVNQQNTYTIRIISKEKRKHISMIDEDYIYYQVKEINTEDYTGKVYNFEVEDDNSYIVHNTAVHNCHLLYDFFVNPDTEELSVSFFQRSNDFALAAVFNIVSASLLTFMLCQITGLKPGKCVHNIGDLHLYTNQIESVKEFMNNSSDINYPVMGFKEKKYENMEDFTCEDFILMFYNSYKKYTIPFST